MDESPLLRALNAFAFALLISENYEEWETDWEQLHRDFENLGGTR